MYLGHEIMITKLEKADKLSIFGIVFLLVFNITLCESGTQLIV